MSRWPDNATDLDWPNPARVHDALLDGSYNFTADRDLARQFCATVPRARLDLFAERHFLNRAVRLCIGAGIRQFLDLGSGIPTVGNACAVAQQAAPDARVLCVDVDPVVVELTLHLLRGNDRASVVQGDLRWPDYILGHHNLKEVLNLDEPVAVLFVSVLHLLADQDNPRAIVARFRDRLAPGSYLVISHITGDRPQAELAARRELTRRTGVPETTRTSDQVQRLFAGFNLVDPGLVRAPLWRPDRDDDDPGGEQEHQSCVLAGVAVKPAPTLRRDESKRCAH